MSGPEIQIETENRVDAASDRKAGDVTGVILAGGRSRRYGRDKALVPVAGTPLIQRVAGVLTDLFQRVVIITNRPKDYDFLHIPMVEDLIRGLGPIGGLHTAFSVLRTEWGFFVACDMPYLNAGLIRHMVSLKDPYDAVVPRIDWKMESLHALYRKRCGEAVRELIARKEYQVIRFFPQVAVRFVSEQEIRRFDPQLKCFFNINEPKQLFSISQRKR